MKKIIEKGIIALLAACVTASSAAIVGAGAYESPKSVSPLFAGEELTEDLTASEGEKAVYTIMNNYAYRLDERFTRSPDTVEFWVRMPVGSLGGTIFSNLYIERKNSPGSVMWGADAAGRIILDWDCGRFKYTFRNGRINDNEWHHVAVVRDPKAHTFTLYIDGEMSDGVTSRQNDLAPAYFPMSVGVDYQTADKEKEPFEGYVRQVTVYNGAITRDRILDDMVTEQITDDYNGQIMCNLFLGDEWTERRISDSTANGVDADLMTFMKYVGDSTVDYEYDYAFMEIPDVQTCVRYHYDTFTEMMGWIADNSSALKVKWATFLGDMSDYGPEESFYRDASIGMDLLNGKLDYNFVPGNHDYDNNCNIDRSQVYFDRWFPYEKHSVMNGFAGAYEEGSMANTYYLYEVCGVKYLIINLEFGPRLSVIRWAGRLCERYPEHRVIVNTHNYVTADGRIMTEKDSAAATGYGWREKAKPTTGTHLWDNLIRLYPNIWMVFSGHLSQDDAIFRTDVGDNGNVIYSWLIDQQTSIHDNGVGEDVTFIIKVNEKTKRMCCLLYSPANDGIYNLQNQFEIPFPGSES